MSDPGDILTLRLHLVTEQRTEGEREAIFALFDDFAQQLVNKLALLGDPQVGCEISIRRGLEKPVTKSIKLDYSRSEDEP